MNQNNKNEVRVVISNQNNNNIVGLWQVWTFSCESSLRGSKQQQQQQQQQQQSLNKSPSATVGFRSREEFDSDLEKFVRLLL
jgi:hypothetical protein